MGRYTTVQTFADNNPSVPKVAYEAAALASSKLVDEDKGTFGTGVTVEKVNNVMGSTAGAGSGDFHTYRHGRRREADRMESMEKKAVEDGKEDAFAARVEAKRKECEERTRKNAVRLCSCIASFLRGNPPQMSHHQGLLPVVQEKRQRKKAKKGGKGNEFAAAEVKDSVAAAGRDSPVSDSEFSYTPIVAGAAAAEPEVPKAAVSEDAVSADVVVQVRYLIAMYSTFLRALK